MDKKDFDRWLRVRTDVAYFKSEESELRKKVGVAVMGEQKTGSAHAELYQHELLASIPVNLTVSAQVQHDTELTDAEKACVVWKPSLIIKEWKKLTKEQRATLAKYVTEKPGSLSITVSEVEQ